MKLKKVKGGLKSQGKRLKDNASVNSAWDKMKKAENESEGYAKSDPMHGGSAKKSNCGYKKVSDA